MAKEENVTLRKIEDAGQIFKILKKFREENQKLFVWKIENESKELFKIDFGKIHRYNRELTFLSNPLEATKLRQFLNKLTEVNFYLPTEGIMFQTSIIDLSENGVLKVRYPNFIAQSERRKDIRLVLGDTMSSKIVFTTTPTGPLFKAQLFEKPLHDLSAGGCSIMVSKLEEKHFRAGELVNDFILRMANIDLRGDLTIVNLIEIEPNATNKLHYRSVKVCFKFRNVDKQEKEQIDDLIFRYIDTQVLAA